MELNHFIKSMKLDDQKRILVSVHEFLESYLSTPENKKMIKDGLIQILGSDFKQLEIGKNVCRITVSEGHEAELLKKLETDLKAAIEMALSFMAENPQDTIKN